MALPIVDDVEQASDNIQALALAQSYFILSESASFKDLMGRIQALVDQAQQEHFSSRQTEPLNIIEEKLRWQQRLLIQQAIYTIVKNQLDTRLDILEENKGETNEYDTAE